MAFCFSGRDGEKTTLFAFSTPSGSVMTRASCLKFRSRSAGDYFSSLPGDFVYHRALHDPAQLWINAISHGTHKVAIAAGNAVLMVAFDRFFRPAVANERMDANKRRIGRMETLNISERLLFYVVGGPSAIKIVLKGLVRFVGGHFVKKLIDLLHQAAGIRDGAVGLSAELALNGHNRHRAFRRKRQNFRRLSVNKFCSQFHRELRSVVRVNAPAEAVARFQQGDLQASFREAAGRGKSGNAAANDQRVHSVAAVTSCLVDPVTGIG